MFGSKNVMYGHWNKKVACVMDEYKSIWKACVQFVDGN